MSGTNNPTALGIGASGMLDGRRYTVRGRVVMGVTIDGQTYYWNEFNLMDTSGGEITLVYEETEEGAEWKLFKLLEPLRPLSASAAAAVRVGDELQMDGRQVRVTLVDQSRVILVEGQAPEGICPGKMANYFNASLGDRMIVVSWSGEEVEYYEGGVTSARRIESAFGLPRCEAFGESHFNASPGLGVSPNFSAVGIVAIVAVMLGFGVWLAFNDENEAAPAPLAKREVSPSHLPVGATGLLEGRRYRIRGHALTEISRVGDRFDGHEYALSTSDDDRAMVVKALQGNSSDWYLLKPGVTPAGFGSFEAANLRQGQSVKIGDRVTQLAQVFQARVYRVDGDDLHLLWPPGVQYGLLARDGTNWILARWNESGLQFFTVEILSDSDVRAAFGADK